MEFEKPTRSITKYFKFMNEPMHGYAKNIGTFYFSPTKNVLIPNKQIK